MLLLYTRQDEKERKTGGFSVYFMEYFVEGKKFLTQHLFYFQNML